MRKSLTIVVLAASLALLGACGSSGGSDEGSAEESTTTTEKATTTTTEAAASDVETWAAAFCGSIDTWLTTIQTSTEAVGQDVQDGDGAGLQAAVAEVYGTMSTATQTLIASIDAEGPPDIDDGDKLQEELLDKFQAVDDAAVATKAQIEGAATDDIATLQSQIDELGVAFQTEVEKATTALADLGDTYPSPELDAAVNASCDF